MVLSCNVCRQFSGVGITPSSRRDGQRANLLKVRLTLEGPGVSKVLFPLFTTGALEFESYCFFLLFLRYPLSSKITNFKVIIINHLFTREMLCAQCLLAAI